MTDRERIIEALHREFFHEYDQEDIIAATVDTALLGVCPVCHRQTPSWLHNPASGEFDILCDHIYHTARERMESEITCLYPSPCPLLKTCHAGEDVPCSFAPTVQALDALPDDIKKEVEG